MPDRVFDECQKCKTPTWCRPARTGPICGGCHVVGFFRNVLFRAIDFDLIPWQEKLLREVYGTCEVDTGKRQFWRAYAEVPKKNGKSFLLGGLPLYHLAAEGIERPEAYGCAAAKDQAGIVFRAAAYLCRNNQLFRQSLKIIDSTKRIVRKDGNGFYAVISADGDLQDGIEPSLAIIDELHRWKTAKAHTLYDVITKGSISRESMQVEITTAGDVNESPICWRQHQRAKRILAGAEKPGRLHVVIYSADEDRVEKDPDYWQSREFRVQANPSHEDNGGFLRDEKIREEIENGKAAYLRYHGNIWGQKDEAWLKSGEWARGNAETRPFLGRPCYIGLDLSSTTDFTAMVCLFPDETDGSYDLLPFFWIPRERVPDLQKRLHVPLDEWIRDGLVVATEGRVVDYDAVKEKIAWAVDDFEVQEICYDPWNATDLVNQLEKAGFNMVKVPQTIVHISAPIKHFHRKILDGKVRHGGHQVLAWHFNGAVVRTDSNGNIALKKPDLGKDSYRIDGAAATITAGARGMIAEESYVSPAELEAAMSG